MTCGLHSLRATESMLLQRLAPRVLAGSRRLWNTLLAACLLPFVLLMPSGAMSQARVVEAKVGFKDAAQKTIVFRGRIDRASVTALADVLSQWQSASQSKSARPTVEIESPGGDVEAALHAGRMLRRAKATVFVFGAPDQAVCSSSCVLLVAGGVERYLIGGLAIHNIFLASEGLTYEQVASTRRRFDESIRAFLVEMNVSPQLYDRMLTVPPQRLRLLTEQEREEFGLGMTDPTFRDFRLGDEASRRGIDKTTYIERLGSLLSICGQPPLPPSPPDSITRSEWQAYQERQTRYATQHERLNAQWSNCKEDVLTGRRSR